MDRYRLIEPLGAGGMSVVWRAFDEVLGRPVAVKLLAPNLLTDSRSRTRIQAEARAAALLSHPHIAQVYDFGHDRDGAPYVVMELVTGRSLEEAGPLPTVELLRTGAQLAAALSAVHARGLVHRDVKPANVMLTDAGAKLVDFGISAIAGDESDQHDEIMGTPAYLAPERIRGLPTTAATDVYALGLLLYRALAGRFPWPVDDDSTTALIEAHRRGRPDPLPRGACRGPVAEAIIRCLAKAPENRPSAAEMAQVLSAAVPREPDRAAVPLGVASVPRSRRTRLAAAGSRIPGGRGRVVAAGVVAAAAVGGLTMCSTGAGPASGPTSMAAAQAAAAPPDPVDCAVQYAVRDGQNGNFDADLRVTASGGGDGGWSLTFRLPAGQAIGAVNGATWSQDGDTVLVGGRDLAAELSAGATFTVTGAAHDNADPPSDFALNGTACRSVQLTTTTTTIAPAPTTAAPAAATPPPGANVKPEKKDKPETKEKPGKPAQQKKEDKHEDH
ncbi:protein kinase domain-containing protein [Dactylosporangium sp. CA-139066]|uniref:protein kinase domain-containing protein n=1 Tax=Dactylosporangium sp. CA-139066 TaxID=3239930 RepID=UPI003D94382F